MGERGSVSVVAAAILGIAMLASLAVAELATIAGGRARAQTAADAAALAAAQSLVLGGGLPELEARRYAVRNRARLDRCRCPPGGAEAIVTVSVPIRRLAGGGSVVRASARAVLAAPPGTDGLDAAFAARLGCLFDRVRGLTIVSGRRTRAEQARLHRLRPHLAAPPGRSKHEVGLAADLGFPDQASRLAAHERAASCGLVFPIPYEPWHVEPAAWPVARAVHPTGLTGCGRPRARPAPPRTADAPVTEHDDPMRHRPLRHHQPREVTRRSPPCREPPS